MMNTLLFPCKQILTSTRRYCPSTIIPRQVTRCFSSPPDTSRRHTGIEMHPESIGQYILPGNVVSKHTLAGKHVWQPVALEYGHFWMLRELRQTEEKPIITTTSTLIDEKQAKVFPTLQGVECLDTTVQPSVIDIPQHWLRKNRTNDPAAQCTVIGLAFRDYGYNMLQEWLPPLQEKLKTQKAFQSRVEVVRLSLNEGYWQRYVLKSLVTASMRRNTADPEEKKRTWIHFATNLNDKFRDPIRAHNLMTAYIYLLDGQGRVRWVATGPPGDDEVEALWQGVQEILRPTLQPRQRKQSPRPGLARKRTR